MDTLTHLVAGAAAPLAVPRAPRRTALVIMGILAGELPDYDVFFGAGSVESHLSFHRGITHALLWQPFLALALVAPFYVYFSATKEKGTFRFGTLYCIGLFALYMHLFLDCMTTFGTQIFLPFSAYRVAIPSLFIVDGLILLPTLLLLIYALRFSCKTPAVYGPQKFRWPWLERFTHVEYTGEKPPAVFSRLSGTIGRGILCWMLFYPLLNLGIKEATTQYLAPRVADAGTEKIHLLTEPFSPFVWKVIAESDRGYRVGTYSYFTSWSPEDYPSFRKVDTALFEALARQLPLLLEYKDFCPEYMVQETRPATGGDATGSGQTGMKEYVFSDLRYVTSPHSPARFFGYTGTVYVFEARVAPGNKLVAYRFLHWSGDASVPWVFLS